MATKNLITAAFVLISVSHHAEAQTYIGVRAQHSEQEVNRIGRVGDRYGVADCRTVLVLYAGARFKYLDLELGGGPLGRRSSQNTSATFDIKQVISTDHVYAAVLPRWRFGDYSMHGIVGFSRVRMKNHEYGRNENGPDQEQRNTSVGTVPIFGAGLQYDLRSVAMRFEAFRIKNVARSYWTESSDIKAVAIGLHYKF